MTNNLQKHWHNYRKHWGIIENHDFHDWGDYEERRKIHLIKIIPDFLLIYKKSYISRFYSALSENSCLAAFLAGIHEAINAINKTVTATNTKSGQFNFTG